MTQFDVKLRAAFRSVNHSAHRFAGLQPLPDDHIQMRGRKYDLFYDGQKLRIVSWRSGKASYWVSNTLGESLTNKQMLGIAQSLSRVGT